MPPKAHTWGRNRPIHPRPYAAVVRQSSEPETWNYRGRKGCWAFVDNGKITGVLFLGHVHVEGVEQLVPVVTTQVFLDSEFNNRTDTWLPAFTPCLKLKEVGLAVQVQWLADKELTGWIAKTDWQGF